MSGDIVGIIESYRRGPKSQRNNQMIVYITNFDRNKINEILGAKAVFKDRYGNVYEGFIKKRHGNGCKVLIEFFRPLPGHSLGKTLRIIKIKND